jgi:O-acetyl-ADP-ribose deacetylase (regulator of RNase III)
MTLHFSKEDITKIHTDAIVNAANKELLMGGGVCGAIFRAAGQEKLKEACRKLAPVETGQAVITPGFDLKSKYIIHTPGPVYDEGDKERSRELLRASYINSLKLAQKNSVKSIAFPLISSGIYGYPKKEAFAIGKEAIEDFLKDKDMEVFLILFGKDYDDLVGKLEN